MRNILFSVSAFCLTAATLSLGGIWFGHKVEEIRSEKEQEAHKPLPVPRLETPPPPVDLAQYDVPPAPRRVPNKVEPKVLINKVVAPTKAKEKEMVCESDWQDSTIGGRYKRCEMR